MVNRLKQALWRMTLPLRAAVRTRVEGLIAVCLARALETQNPARVVADEVNLVLDTVIAEQFRLQDQVEELRPVARGDHRGAERHRLAIDARFAGVIAHSESGGRCAPVRL